MVATKFSLLQQFNFVVSLVRNARREVPHQKGCQKRSLFGKKHPYFTFKLEVLISSWKTFKDESFFPTYFYSFFLKKKKNNSAF